MRMRQQISPNYVGLHQTTYCITTQMAVISIVICFKTNLLGCRVFQHSGAARFNGAQGE